MADIRERLTELFVQIGNKARIFVRKFIAIAKDPVKLWDYGRALTIAIPSSLFLLPFTVEREDDGLFLLAVRSSKWLRGISYIFSSIIAIRLAYFATICLDSNFQWNYDGKFTADAITFGMCILMGCLGYLSHFTLLYSAEDFVFLHNTVMRLNRRFSGSFPTLFCWQMYSNFSYFVLQRSTWARPT